MKKLVIAEKPSVAKDYAQVLKCRKSNGYFEGDEYIVTWAFGHLFTLLEPGEYDEKYKKWNLNDLPIVPERLKIKLIDNPGVKNQYKIIEELIKREDVDAVVIGTDAGREGELIGRYILMASENSKPVYRLWLSSLTEEDIFHGFKNLVPISKFDNLYYSAQARAELDWILGMNLTRAYTLKKGRNVLLSVGRCQTPVLALICKRDEEIEAFKSDNYWELKTYFKEGYWGKWIDKDNNSRFDKNEDAEKVRDEVINKLGIVSDLKKELKKKPHPFLFNLTNLQRAVNRKYGYSAQEVLDTMQILYEKHKILSYPRTASRHITESMVSELPKIISCVNFGKFKTFAGYCLSLEKLPITKRIADDSMVTDHTAIIPVYNRNTAKIYETLNEKEKNVFDEVVLTFLSVFHGDYVYESTSIITAVKNHRFITRGVTVVEPGWRQVYQEADEEESNEEEDGNSKLPVLELNQDVTAEKANIEEKKTSPPPRFTENLLLKTMENPTNLIEEESLKAAIKGHGIGTEATRATLIETLIKRGFIERKKKQIISTQLGRDLIKNIETEVLKSPSLTASWEQNLEKIYSGEIQKEDFMLKSINFVRREISKLVSSKNTVFLTKPMDEQKEKEIKEKSMGKCPLCGSYVIEKSAGYGCIKHKETGCAFFVTNTIYDKKISATQMKKLLSKGKTDVIKGFKKGDRKFDAALLFKDGKLGFELVKN